MVWLFGFCSLLIYAPLAIVVVLVVAPHLGPVQYLFMFGSGVLHLGYFVFCSGDTRSGTSRSSIHSSGARDPCSRQRRPS